MTSRMRVHSELKVCFSDRCRHGQLLALPTCTIHCKQEAQCCPGPLILWDGFAGFYCGHGMGRLCAGLSSYSFHLGLHVCLRCDLCRAQALSHLESTRQQAVFWARIEWDPQHSGTRTQFFGTHLRPCREKANHQGQDVTSNSCLPVCVRTLALSVCAAVSRGLTGLAKAVFSVTVYLHACMGPRFLEPARHSGAQGRTGDAHAATTGGSLLGGLG